MTTAKTKKTAVAKNTKTTKKASQAAKNAPAKKTAAKKAPAKKAPAKKAPVKAVKQEKEMTKALVAVEEPKTVETPVETVTEEPKAEKVQKTEKVKKEKKKKVFIKVHHELGPSRGGKIQKRLKGTSTGKNKWGHKVRSQAAMIDELVEAGRYTITEIQVMSGARTKGRIFNHFRALKEKGFPVVQDNKLVKFA